MPNQFKSGSMKRESPLKNREKSFFSKKQEEKEKKEKEFHINDEEFPGLGRGVEIDGGKSFIAAVKKRNEPKKKKVDPYAGWIEIKKGGEIIQHEDSGRYRRVRAMLDEMDENVRWSKIMKRIAEYEHTKSVEAYFNGPEYIQSWEVNDYLREREKEMIKNEEQTECSDSDDYEYE